MKALVKFITLSPAQVDEINAKGWDCAVGRAYMNATCNVNPVLALATGLYQDAARLDGDENFIFRALQNVNVDWKTLNAGTIECLTDRPRSMMVGDLIIFEDGRCLICDRYGWKDLKEFS